MRVVLDTNVLVSALLVATSLPAQLITLWREGQFTQTIRGARRSFPPATSSL